MKMNSNCIKVIKDICGIQIHDNNSMEVKSRVNGHTHKRGRNKCYGCRAPKAWSQYLTQQQPLGAPPCFTKGTWRGRSVFLQHLVKNKFSFTNQNRFKALTIFLMGEIRYKTIRT